MSVLHELARRVVESGDVERATRHAMDFAREIARMTAPVPEDGHSVGVYSREAGWLVDTSGVWSFDVREAQPFPSERAAQKALEDMIDNGHTEIMGFHKLFCPRLS